jgi:hypothetical protein
MSVGEIEGFLVANGQLPSGELAVAPRRVQVHLFRAIRRTRSTF